MKLISDGIMLLLYITMIYFAMGQPENFPIVTIVIGVTFLRVLDFIFVRLLWDKTN